MKIATIRAFHNALFSRDVKPTHITIDEAFKLAKKQGVTLDRNGRAYAPFLPATPLLPNGRHGRWEKGQVVPRKRVS